MPRYLIERRFDVTEDEMAAVGSRSKRIAKDHYPEVAWEHSHVVVGDDGKVTTYCVYQAPDEDQIRRHAEELGQHRVVAVLEIAGDVTPRDFPI